MLLTRIITITLLLLFITDSKQVKVYDTDACTQRSIDNEYKSGSEDDRLLCPTDKNCTDVLSNVVSNGIINITTDVVLSVKRVFKCLENITIVGHGNVTLYFQSDGAVKFVSCKNVTIENIKWKNYGSSNETSPAKIEFFKSAKVAIHNCSFHHIKGPAIVLSEVLGNVHITSCSFTHINIQYGDHGAVMYYSSETASLPKLELIIYNCKFSFNEVASGVLYIKGNNNSDHIAVVQNSVFVENQGVSIYNLHTSLYLRGSVLFDQNKANSGGGIASIQSSIILDDRSYIRFFNNTAISDGGAIWLSQSRLQFKRGTIAYFEHNTAENNGGAVFSENESQIIFGKNSLTYKESSVGENGGALLSAGHHYNISFDGSSTVLFAYNRARLGGALFHSGNSQVTFNRKSIVEFFSNHAQSGGAAYSRDYSAISFKESSMVSFINNSAVKYGSGLRANFHCSVTFEDNTTVKFDKHTAERGAISLKIYSNISFNGESMVTFNNNTATWGGAVYSEYYSSILFDGNSIVTFSNNNAKRFGGALFPHVNCSVTFENNATVMFNNNTATWGGAVYSGDYSSILFDENSMVTFSNNNAVNHGGALNSHVHCSVTFENNATVMFNNNTATWGGAVYSGDYSSILFDENSMVTFSNNNAAESGGALNSHVHCSVTFENNATVMFNNNTATWGGAVYSGDYSSILFDENSMVTFSNNNAAKSGGALNSHVHCSVTFENNATVMFNNNTATWGGAVYSKDYSSMLFDGRSMVTFSNNNAERFGGALYLHVNCSVIFENNTTVMFNNNTATWGGAVYSGDYSSILFDENSMVTFSNNNAVNHGGALNSHVHCSVTFENNATVMFNNNTATWGGAVYSGDYSSILFDENSMVTFSNNNAAKSGGALNSHVHCSVTFENNATVMFNNNTATWGGAVYSKDYSSMLFDGRSMVTFSNNNAERFGGALYLHVHCSVIFENNTTVMFNNNMATWGGAVCSEDYSSILFDGHSVVTFYDNKAADSGGGLRCYENSRVLVENNSMVIFTANTANTGGAVHCSDNSYIVFVDNSNVSFSHNSAMHGGAMYSSTRSSITIKGTSTVTLNYNIATQNGGAISSSDTSNITLSGNSTILFLGNTARQDGGAIYSVFNVRFVVCRNSSLTFKHNTAAQHGGAMFFTSQSVVFFKESSVSVFHNNSAKINGGAVYSFSICQMYFEESSNVLFSSNNVRYFGGVMYLNNEVSVSISGNTMVMFHNNSARSGGALYTIDNTSVTIKDYSLASFLENEVTQYGGAVHCDGHSDFTLEGNAFINFTMNNASYGGAISVFQSALLLSQNSSTWYGNNAATRNGGAVHLSDVFTAVFSDDVSFYYNNADKYGGAIYADLTQDETPSKIEILEKTDFYKNSASVGPSVYIDVQDSCNKSCLNNTVLGINKNVLTRSSFVEHISTPPNELVLYEPATCIDDDNDTSCNTYLVKDIMLGQNIKLGACVLDYYDKPADGAQFLVEGKDEAHNINGSNFISISCDKFEGINVAGQRVLNVTNFSMTLTSRACSQSNQKTITVELAIELSPCHPGFHYDVATNTCVCYSVNDVIYCSGSTSTIKTGYWFGLVGTTPTVTTCPSNYCIFTCCESINGFYKLSPQRMNQCNSHRSGPACGSCEQGYTLSFDTVECVSVDQCTTGQMVLVVSLSILYWIVTVVAVFIVTYYHIGIGYLYAITFYYSMLDILLSHDQTLHSSRGLFTTVNTISSISKIIPQFLGQLCLVENMSGIDQQFIHYVHPLAVTIILAMICLLARMSYRFSLFVSRGIIHVICFLLLLSYTSLATTSLLLLRPLTFHNVNKAYTYLSPDIEYFHGRHLPYVIVAVLCTIVIVIGLPLLLLLEPYLNGKINFTRIKPLLDHFQGSYKDQYRSFAAYYMVCRLVIIVVIISNPSNNNTTQVLLVTISTTLASIHLLLKPYANDILNIFDGIILQFMVLVTVVPLVESFHPDLLLTVIIALVILPLITFAVMELIIYKEKVKNFVTYCKPNPVSTSKDNDIPIRYIGIIVDDRMRENATICEMLASNIVIVSYKLLVVHGIIYTAQ